MIAAALAVTPGADTMLVMKNAVRLGSAAGWATTAGILGGVAMHAVASALGISVIVAQSDALFQLIKGLGAVYLVWLGFQAIRNSWNVPGTAHPTGSGAARGAFREGLITNVLNPKVAIFYIAFLPQFIDPADPVLAKSLLLAGIHNALSLIWLGGLVLVVAWGKGWIQRPRVQQTLSQVSGVLLIGLGLRLALESRQ